MNLYAPRFWIQPYFRHNIIKYEVTLQIFQQKHIFLFSTRVEENKSHVKVQYIVMNIQINTIK